MTHYYAWRNNSKRLTLYKRPCRIVARGAHEWAKKYRSGQDCDQEFFASVQAVETALKELGR